jgi:hypothetical protein
LNPAIAPDSGSRNSGSGAGWTGRSSRAAFHELFAKPVNGVAVAKPLDDRYEKGASWETVKPYIECIFTVVDLTTKASPGKEFAIEGAE